MKNRVFIYCCSAFGMLALVAVINYFCYHSAVQQFTKQQQTYESQLNEKMEAEISDQVSDKWEEKVQNENVAVENNQIKLDINTVYQIENYDAVKGQTTTAYETVPEEFIGFTREDADAYFKKYMTQLPVEEYLNGLQSIGVTSFSSERLVIQKIYDSSKVAFRYYLIAVDGEIVVYYGDKKTVYEYTGIATNTLSAEEQADLKKGIEIKDEDELFGVLENYSS